MNYVSTRNKDLQVSSAQAIAQGISTEGGLFVPENFPRLDAQRLQRLVEMNYVQRACDILGDYLTDFSPDEILQSVSSAYGSQKFASEFVAPLSKLSPDVYLLELWHGPTCAFKDMALQLLPHLLTRSAKKVGGASKTAILVATSGDTGKAALEGFADVPGTQILVFYPHNGVSEIQRLQMATQKGGNVGVCAVKGNFDDTQTGVKQIFTDPQLAQQLGQADIAFSSANSINWGRLVPQIVYYVSSYCDMVAAGEIKLGDSVNVAVPTGNFGNILAAYYAKQMGLPIGKFICASNENHVLTDFIQTGVYDRRREFVLTSSPSMDILISSNLERLLFDLHQRDDGAVSHLMQQLADNGVYKLDAQVCERLQNEFYGGYCDQVQTAATVREIYEDFGYLCDTHTAVAIKVHRDYVAQTGDNTKTILASTAHPYKFAPNILEALTGERSSLSEFDQVKILQEKTGVAIPPKILELASQPVRFHSVCDTHEMEKEVLSALGLH